MYGKALNVRQADKFLKDHGFNLDHTKGGHLIYKNKSLGQTITITNNDLSQKTWKRELKKCGLEKYA